MIRVAPSDSATSSSGAPSSRGASSQPFAVTVPAGVARLASSNRTRTPSGVGTAAKPPASFSPRNGRSSRSETLTRRRPAATSANTPCPLASNRPLAPSTATGPASVPRPRPVNRPLARKCSSPMRSVTGAETWRSSRVPRGAASARVFSVAFAAGPPSGATSATRSSMRANSALTISEPSRPSPGRFHTASMPEAGHDPREVETTRSRAASAQPSGVRSALNEALASSKPRRLPMWTAPGDCAWIVPVASTGRPPSQVLHTSPDTTPVSVVASRGPASSPSRARSTFSAAR